MNSIDLLRATFRNAHETLEGTMADVTPAQAHWLPAGAALPIGALYAHTIQGEDAILSTVLLKTQPLFASKWQGRTGLSELEPQASPWDSWARSVHVNLGNLREYAAAVYAQTDEYLATLSPESLDVEVQFAGTRTLGDALGCIMVAHINNHCGEISCLKGLLGAKGYPF